MNNDECVVRIGGFGEFGIPTTTCEGTCWVLGSCRDWHMVLTSLVIQKEPSAMSVSSKNAFTKTSRIPGIQEVHAHFSWSSLKCHGGIPNL